MKVKFLTLIILGERATARAAEGIRPQGINLGTSTWAYKHISGVRFAAESGDYALEACGLNITPEQWVSECGSQTNSSSLTWKLVREANSQAAQDPLSQKLWGWGPAMFSQAFQVVLMCAQFWEGCFQSSREARAHRLLQPCPIKAAPHYFTENHLVEHLPHLLFL